MKVIWKYQLQTSHQEISMPAGAEILTVQVQGNMLCIWALVDASNLPENREFFILPTSQEFDATNKRYIGTFQMNGGALIFHVFEQGKN